MSPWSTNCSCTKKSLCITLWIFFYYTTNVFFCQQTSDDDAATMSTSGISTLDTASEVTQSKGEASPNSDGSSSDGQQKDVEEDGEEAKNDKQKTDEISEKKDEGTEDASERKIIADKKNEEMCESRTKDLPEHGHLSESEQSDIILDEKEAVEQRVEETNKDNALKEDLVPASVISDTNEGTKESVNLTVEGQKCRYVSSSESSSDGEKFGETLTITETPESSSPRGRLTSEDSLESSPEPQLSPPPHYFTAGNGMLALWTSTYSGHLFLCYTLYVINSI